jgi:hypothetical protein
LLPFGRFFFYFDLAGLKMHPEVGIKRQNFHSSDAFVFQTDEMWGGSQLISISPMHFVFQTAVRCEGSQLIERGTRVANLGDFSSKNANLGTLRIFERF